MTEFSLLTKWKAEKPPGSELARRAWVEIKYTPAGEKEEVDITEDISEYLISLDYTDNLSDTADDITLTLEDRAQLWLKDWLPDGEGNMIDVTVHYYNRINLTDGEVILRAGKFEIDEITINGFPSTVQIKAVSVIGSGSLRAVRRNKTWEKITVQAIANDICSQNGLTLFWDCEDDPTIKHMEQADQSDLEFLQQVCEDKGLSMKVTPTQIIILDEAKYEAQKPNIVVFRPGVKADISGIPLPLRWLTSYNFNFKSRDTYASCVVECQKGEKKKVLTGGFYKKGEKKGQAKTKTVREKKKVSGTFSIGDSGRVLHIRKQVEDDAEAERLAKKKLREANKDAITGSFTTIDNPNFAAGLTVEMRHFGRFDGVYIITKVSHKFSSGECTTTVDVRRCLDGY